MEVKDNHRIFNVGTILLPTSGGVQYQDVRINCPFPVKKIVFNPPHVYIAVGDVKTDSYLISAPALNPDSNGAIGFFKGSVEQYPYSKPVVVKFSDSKLFNGTYPFIIRAFAEVAGGNSNPITAKIAMIVEFHSE